MERLTFRESPPHAALDPWIRCYYLLESPPEDVRRREGLLVPDGYLELGFNLGGRRFDGGADGWSERSQSCVDDVLVRSRPVRWDGAVRHVGVKFRYEAGLTLLGIRPSDVQVRPLDATTLSLPGFTELADQLAANETWSMSTNRLDGFFLKQISKTRPDPIVAAGAAAIRSSGGAISIKRLAQSLGTSRRLVERRILARTGLTPKRLAQIVRTRKAIQRIIRRPGRSLTEVALELGFYDQSHFIREFRATVGEVPTSFFAGDHFVSDFCNRVVEPPNAS